MKKNIAIFTGYYLPHLGGVEQYTYSLANELINQGNKVCVISSNYDNLESYEKDKITLYRLPVYNIFKNRYPIFKKDINYKLLLEKLEKENIDYVICNTRFYLTSFIAYKFAQKKNIPIICIEHGSSHLSVNNKILDFFGSIYEHFETFLLKRKINDYYGVSKKCNDWLKHFKINAKGIFYNSIDEKLYNQFKNTRFSLKLDNKTVLCYAGRVIKEKGLYNLLEAFSILEKKYNNIALVVAGDGKDLADLREKYQSKNIYYLGKIAHDEVMKLFNSSDIFINSSMYPEGLPTTILEAGLMKNVILATNRGGTKEVIDDQTGIIIEENVESIVNNIKKILDDKKLMLYYKNSIHKKVIDNFTWHKTALKVLKAFERTENENKRK